MEIIYFIYVIRSMIDLLSKNTKQYNMKGGSIGKAIKMAKKAKRSAGISARQFDSSVAKSASGLSSSLSKSLGKFAEKAGVKEGEDGKRRLISAERKESMLSSLKTMSGMTTASERVKSPDALLGIYRMVKFLVYLLSAFLVPFMPFYAATKSFFQKGIPFMKEVAIPESVDYEAKMQEQELKEQAAKNKQ